jgi:hypothetical protein
MRARPPPAWLGARGSTTGPFLCAARPAVTCILLGLEHKACKYVPINPAAPLARSGSSRTPKVRFHRRAFVRDSMSANVLGCTSVGLRTASNAQARPWQGTPATAPFWREFFESSFFDRFFESSRRKQKKRKRSILPVIELYNGQNAFITPFFKLTRSQFFTRTDVLVAKCPRK